MKIKTKIKFVEGDFDTEIGKLVCVQKRKYGSVNICLGANMNIPVAEIKLYSSNLAIDADAVFEDACKLGDEIVRRWNESPTKK